MPLATIDRFEEELAILIIDGKEVQRSRAELPPEAREGDVIDTETLQLDPVEREKLTQRVREARAAAKPKKRPGSFDL